ncbi:MAG TPA: T9SS type A sorting domain-containing protein, partial [Flavitalea sp.]|nr:T9SS type A sorting domain-containing protein [Flavitalea sp.]
HLLLASKGLTGIPHEKSANVEPVIETKKIRIYPNPVETFLNVEVSGVAGKKLTVYNQHGQPLKQYVLNKNTLQVDMENYPCGIYFVKFEGEGQSVKVIKK